MKENGVKLWGGVTLKYTEEMIEEILEATLSVLAFLGEMPIYGRHLFAHSQ